jgi:hypothetical protein
VRDDATLMDMFKENQVGETESEKLDCCEEPPKSPSQVRIVTRNLDIRLVTSRPTVPLLGDAKMRMPCQWTRTLQRTPANQQSLHSNQANRVTSHYIQL